MQSFLQNFREDGTSTLASNQTSAHQEVDFRTLGGIREVQKVQEKLAAERERVRLRREEIERAYEDKKTRQAVSAEDERKLLYAGHVESLEQSENDAWTALGLSVNEW